MGGEKKRCTLEAASVTPHSLLQQMQCNAAATVVGKESFRQPKAVVHAEVELDEEREGGESEVTAVRPTVRRCTSIPPLLSARSDGRGRDGSGMPAYGWQALTPYFSLQRLTFL